MEWCKKIFGKTNLDLYRETKAVAMMACSMVYGPYKNIAGAYESFAYWLDKIVLIKCLSKLTRYLPKYKEAIHIPIPLRCIASLF